ncbi:enoyl-CoA hydratase-related protein [Gordonia sp. ABSL1-1]|uniref:enoyl-CoA hydratase/isomerase family protein n=1 Tax=Gordonia sp. ABSL1-1 TaxID=3053923 RepID=UPI002573A3F1|nr:enoyl-CoA hydratase-related protein [Gordonia sp. ABSL1-1]MDL9935436.1 enoyl-CoA hydratase-related protein [Gordonia sp. ABSL1-1]
MNTSVSQPETTPSTDSKTDRGIDVETGSPTVLAEISDGVGIVTLNRPERRNALHPEMYDAVPAVLERFAADDEVGAVIITAAGTAFCAGGDVRDGKARRAAAERVPTVEERTAELSHNARMVRFLHEMPKVTIAALPGAAVGAGMSIALAADFRIAARSAKLIPGWSKLAFSGDFGGTWFLTRLVGPSAALEILVEDRPITADAALERGLVNRVVDDADLPAAARAWAAQIAAGPHGAYAAMKANVVQTHSMTLAEALPIESERMVRAGLTDEHKAAVRAWLAAAKKR